MRLPGSISWWVAVTLACGWGALLPRAAGAGGVEVLLIASAHDLTLYNRYQQMLTPRERRELSPGAPFIVRNRESTLGDGFTTVLELSHAGRTYFAPLHIPGHTAVERVRGATLLDDTLQCLERGGVVVHCAGEAALPLQRGDLVRRIFRAGGKTYAATMVGRGNQECFGWLTTGPRGTWEPYRTAAAPRIAPDDDIQQRVHQALARANETYAAFFEEFNRQSGREEPVPRWVATVGEGAIRCRLEGSAHVQQGLERSTSALAAQMQRELGDRTVTVVREGTDIVVSIGR